MPLLSACVLKLPVVVSGCKTSKEADVGGLLCDTKADMAAQELNTSLVFAASGGFQSPGDCEEFELEKQGLSLEFSGLLES